MPFWMPSLTAASIGANDWPWAGVAARVIATTPRRIPARQPAATMRFSTLRTLFVRFGLLWAGSAADSGNDRAQGHDRSAGKEGAAYRLSSGMSRTGPGGSR